MNSFFRKLGILVLSAPFIYLALVWQKLPESVPLHFDMDGTPNRYGSKAELLFAVLLINGIAIGMYFFLPQIYRLDPKKTAVDNKDRLQKISVVIGIFLAGITCLMIYATTQGRLAFNTGLVFGSVGLLLAILGNYMHNVKPNYFFGLRLPWTLDDPENWKRTHALAGKLWFAGGLLMSVLCLLLPGKASFIAFFSILAIMLLVPIIYSYRFYKTHSHETH